MADETGPLEPNAEQVVSNACDALLDQFVAKAEPRIRKHADEVYEALLTDVQEYLRENANWNLANELRRIERVDAENRKLIEQRRDLLGMLEAIQRRAHDETNEQHEWGVGDMVDALRSIDALAIAALALATPTT